MALAVWERIFVSIGAFEKEDLETVKGGPVILPLWKKVSAASGEGREAIATWEPMAASRCDAVPALVKSRRRLRNSGSA
ncbi:MAG: hypothetical protein ACXWAW_12505, partial [Usitatibacter sp.]